MSTPVWIRVWLRAPALSLTLLAVMAVGIGATTATFSLVYSLVLRPLPFDAPEQLMVLQTQSSSLRGNARRVSLPDLEDYRREARLVTSFSAFSPERFGLLAGGSARPVEYARVTAGFFETLGIAPLLGRTIGPEDDRPGGASDVAVISYALWRDRFGLDPQVLGQPLRTSVTTLTVVGVMPASFSYPSGAELWVPVQSLLQVRGVDRTTTREARAYITLARLAPGATREQAEGELQSIGRTLARSYPETNEGMQPVLTPLHDYELGVLQGYAWMLFAAVVTVLGVCAANVSNLLLVRLSARTREIAVRTALGASMRQLVRAHLLECLAITLVGGLAGLGLAAAAIRVLPHLAGGRLPGWMSLELHAPVLLFALAITVLTGLVIGLVPGLLAARTEVHEVLKQGSRGNSAAGRVKRSLVIAEVALAALLLVAAGLLLRTVDSLRNVDTGFDAENLMTVQLSPFVPGTEQERIRRSTAYFQRVVERLRELPGAVAAGGTDRFPFIATYPTRPTLAMEAKGDLQTDVIQRAPAALVDVTPQYFETMRIPLLEGRAFREDDDLDAPWVIILSRRAADRLFPGRPAIGQQVRTNTAGATDPWATVIGVVGNVKIRATDTDEALEFYYPYKQYGLSTTRIGVRFDRLRPGIEDEVRRTAAAVDPDTPVEDVRSMRALMDETLWQQRLWSAVLTGFAATALALAALGLYGLLAFSVGQRRREIGVRLALGSRPAAIVRLVAVESLTLVGTGLLLGLAGGVAAARAMGSVLFAVSWLDPWTYLVVAAALLTTGLAAASLPAIRATRIDPVIALRND